MSRQIFCRRVKDEIGTELEGPLENRRREGVVDQTESAVAWAIFAAALISVIRRSGLVGDSIQTSRVRRVMARSISLTLEVSTKENVSPKFCNTALKSR